MSKQIFLIILIPIISSQIKLLNIEKPNLFENDIKYNCKLSINDIKKSLNDIKYIVFNFLKEPKTKRNEIYISKNKDETINSKTKYKLALFGSNKIIIPYDYAKNEEYLYIQINCYKNKNCNEEIIINLYNKIKIEEGETLYINGYKENYIYEFESKYKKNENNNILIQLTANTYHKNDFEFEIINNKTEINKIFNGYSYYLTNNEYKNLKENDVLIIKIINPNAYIIIQIISIDNTIQYNDIDLFRPIIGLLKEGNDKRCFYINDEENKNKDLYIDFMIEDEMQSLIYEDDKQNSFNIFYSQTIKANNKFCIKKFYNNIKEIIYFYFSIYFSEIKSYVRNQSYLGLLYNGYLYKKILSENGSQMEYFPSEYNDYLLYFYINLQRGVINLDHIITNNFPFTKDKIEDKNFKLLNINKIGNEYFGIMLINEKNNMSSSPMNPNKNILSIDCESGVNFDENDNFCEFNIMFYTQNDIIHLRQNEKFSFLNYDSPVNPFFYEIKLKIEITIPLLLNINDNFNYKLVIDTYTQLGSSYINLENNKEFFYSKNIKTFYNDNLISKEIVFDYDRNKNAKFFESNQMKYQFEIISQDYDFVSILISGTNQNENEIVETRLWFNGYILTTLSKRIPKRIIILDNLHMYATNYNKFRTFILLKYLNCDVKTGIIDIETKKDISNDKIE